MPCVCAAARVRRECSSEHAAGAAAHLQRRPGARAAARHAAARARRGGRGGAVRVQRGQVRHCCRGRVQPAGIRSATALGMCSFLQLLTRPILRKTLFEDFPKSPKSERRGYGTGAEERQRGRSTGWRGGAHAAGDARRARARAPWRPLARRLAPGQRSRPRRCAHANAERARRCHARARALTRARMRALPVLPAQLPHGQDAGHRVVRQGAWPRVNAPPHARALSRGHARAHTHSAAQRAGARAAARRVCATRLLAVCRAAAAACLASVFLRAADAQNPQPTRFARARR
jgi:hypothetical protein